MLTSPQRDQHRRTAAELKAPRIAAFLAVTLSACILCFIVLAAYTRVDQVTRAPGSITPLGHYTNIENLEGGIVSNVYALDGNVVSEGALLLELENPTLSREFATLSKRIAALETRLENANAVLDVLEENRTLSEVDLSEVESKGLTNATATLQLYLDGQTVRKSSLESRQRTLQMITEAEAFARLRLDRQELRVSEQNDLFERGLIVRSVYEVDLDRADTLRAASAEALIRLAEAEQEVSTAEAEIESARLSLLESTLLEATNIEQELSTSYATREILASRIAALTISAPSDGRIQAVAFAHRGEIIEPGETLFELLPEDDTLILEVSVPSHDVGFIHLSQPVSFTVDTFDVRRFGRVDGKIASISPAPVIDPQTGNANFRVTVELAASEIGKGQYRRDLQAGMTGVAEITSNEQTLLSYFLKPVHTTLSRSFTEN